MDASDAGSQMDRIEIPGVAELSKKLDLVLNILLHFALKDTAFNQGEHTAGDLAVWLKGVGLNNSDIAIILGSTPESVRVSLHNKKKPAKRAKKGK